MKTLLEELAMYIHDLSYEDLPSDVVETTKTLILHHLYTGYSGINQKESQVALSIVKNYAQGIGKSTILGQKHKVAATESSFANAILMHSIQQEDTYLGLHPGPHTIPAAISLAEQESKTGKDILTSIVAGYDVNLRIGEVCAQYTSPKGWRGTSVFGILGAAASSAKVMGLDLEPTVSSLAIAANLSSGLMECWKSGTPEWLFTSGLAVRNGVISALIAKSGINAARASFEGEKGFFKAYCGTIPSNIDVITHDLGKDFPLLRVNLKPYPVITTILPVIHNVLNLAKQENIESGDVQKIKIVASPRITEGPLSSSVLDWGPYTSETQCFKSLPCAIGIALQFREVSIETIKNYGDPRVSEIAEKVTVETEKSARGYYNSVEMTTKDGRTCKLQGEEFPSLTREEVKVNLKKAATKFMPEEKVDKLIQAIQNMENLSITDLSKYLS